MKNNENTAQAIDFAIISIFVQIDKIPRVNITVMDITFGKKLKDLSSKIKGFVQSVRKFLIKASDLDEITLNEN